MDQDQTGDERHTIENKGQVGAVRRVRERAVDSRAKHDIKSIICFKPNKPATVHFRLSNPEEEKQRTKQNSDSVFLPHLYGHSSPEVEVKWAAIKD